MTYNKLVLPLLLWSCSSYAQLGTMVTVPRDYSKVSEEIVIENMPRVRSQDSLPICFGMSSAVVAQFYVCKERQISKCNHVDSRDKNSLNPKFEISPMSMVAWANKNDLSVGGRDGDHTNLYFNGNGGFALDYLAESDTNTVLRDSCYPLDQLANEYGFENKKKLNDNLEDLREDYKKRTEADFCQTCIVENLQQNFKVKTEAEDILSNLEIEPFDQFLYAGVFGSCGEKPIGFKTTPKFVTFPLHGSTANYKDTISKIKEVLSKTRYPMVLDNVCGSFDGDGKCIKHSVVIHGYKKICKVDNSSCREVLKIQNSWGEDWQKQNDDGWLDAKTLLGDKPIEYPGISWWEPPN